MGGGGGGVEGGVGEVTFEQKVYEWPDFSWIPM